MNRCTHLTGTGWDSEVCYKPVFRSRSRCFDHGGGMAKMLTELTIAALKVIANQPRRRR